MGSAWQDRLRAQPRRQADWFRDRLQQRLEAVYDQVWAESEFLTPLEPKLRPIYYHQMRDIWQFTFWTSGNRHRSVEAVLADGIFNEITMAIGRTIEWEDWDWTHSHLYVLFRFAKE